jgi:flagellar hook assembly protein FlgD
MLTDAANDVQLTIYTVTGRPIKTWKFSNLIGYQEISWDGRDLDGYRIANGTYYAKLTVKNKSKKLKKLIKIAKLEGY